MSSKRLIACLTVGLCLFSACHKDDYLQEPENASRLIGHTWVQVDNTKPGKRLYSFGPESLKTQLVDFGKVIYSNEYAYRVEQDTVYLTDVVSGSADKWAVWMFDDEQAQVTSGAGGSNPAYFRLKRY